jgi:hypothetical protein
MKIIKTAQLHSHPMGAAHDITDLLEHAKHEGGGTVEIGDSDMDHHHDPVDHSLGELNDTEGALGTDHLDDSTHTLSPEGHEFDDHSHESPMDIQIDFDPSQDGIHDLPIDMQVDGNDLHLDDMDAIDGDDPNLQLNHLVDSELGGEEGEGRRFEDYGHDFDEMSLDGDLTGEYNPEALNTMDHGDHEHDHGLDGLMVMDDGDLSNGM